jgi:hypothetical protein
VWADAGITLPATARENKTPKATASGVLFALTTKSPTLMVAVQALDGIAAAAA